LQRLESKGVPRPRRKKYKTNTAKNILYGLVVNKVSMVGLILIKTTTTTTTKKKKRKKKQTNKQQQQKKHKNS